MNLVETYSYQAAGTMADMVDKAFRAILQARRPRTLAVLKIFPSPWLFKVFGINLKVVVRHNGLYKEYEVLQYDELIGTFSVRLDLDIAK